MRGAPVVVGALLSPTKIPVAGTPTPPLDTSTTTWGWIHLVVGAVVVAAGFLVFAGKVWARAVGVVVASSVGCQPLPARRSSGLGLARRRRDLVVILALSVHGSEIKAG